MKYSYLIDVAFEIISDKEILDYQDFLDAMQRRLNTLKTQPEPEAFSVVDCVEVE